jgi:MYXO-CTERM domain-containing protein
MTYDYDLELATYTGELALPTATNGGDAVTLVAIYQDINNTSFITVPEPGGALLGLVGLGAAGLVTRRRPGRSGA